MTREYDTIVLGLGGIGSGAAYWLARSGSRVLGLEQFSLDHVRGESHDHSRIIRLSYHLPEYVRLAKEAYAAWAEVESDAGEQLVFITGGLDLGPRDGAIPLQGYADAMDTCDVPYERLDAAEIRRRFPAFSIGENVTGLFQAQGGIVAAQRATAAHQRAARAHGATLLDNAVVSTIERRGGEIVVEANGSRFSAGSLVITAGPWTNVVLASLDMHLPLEVTKEQAMYFVPRDLAPFAFGTFPVWIWMDDPSYYGFPVFGEPGAVKVTQDAGGLAVDPDRRDFEPDARINARVRGFLEEHIPALAGDLHLVKTCLYTLTPDRDFVIDTLPEAPNVSVAIGAGHAFKFASVIGRILSDLARENRTESGIELFSFDRPILHMAQPPKRYMV